MSGVITQKAVITRWCSTTLWDYIVFSCDKWYFIYRNKQGNVLPPVPTVQNYVFTKVKLSIMYREVFYISSNLSKLIQLELHRITDVVEHHICSSPLHTILSAIALSPDKVYVSTPSYRKTKDLKWFTLEQIYPSKFTVWIIHWCYNTTALWNFTPNLLGERAAKEQMVSVFNSLFTKETESVCDNTPFVASLKR